MKHASSLQSSLEVYKVKESLWERSQVAEKEPKQDGPQKLTIGTQTVATIDLEKYQRDLADAQRAMDASKSLLQETN